MSGLASFFLRFYVESVEVRVVELPSGDRVRMFMSGSVDLSFRSLLQKAAENCQAQGVLGPYMGGLRE